MAHTEVGAHDGVMHKHLRAVTVPLAPRRAVGVRLRRWRG